MSEARHHPHHQARGSFIEDEDGVWEPAPAPRFSRTKAELRGHAAHLGEHTDEILAEFGFTEDEIKAKYEAGAVTAYTPE
jgi:alpha-methylacyl-CoA racemase